jgi:hypothetical protein
MILKLESENWILNGIIKKLISLVKKSYADISK